MRGKGPRGRGRGRQDSLEKTGDVIVDRYLEEQRNLAGRLSELNRKKAETKAAKKLRNAERRSRQRAAQTETQKAKRLNDARLRSEESRRKETEDAKAQRLTDKRQRSEESRKMEGDRAKRLSDERLRSEESRRKETEEAKAQRLTDKRQRSEELRRKEMEGDRAKRLADARLRSEESRRKETEDDKVKRLTDKRQRSEESRRKETEDNRAKRLTDKRQQSAEALRKETWEKMSQRRTSDRGRKRERREEATADERIAWRAVESKRKSLNRRKLVFSDEIPSAKRRCVDEGNHVPVEEERAMDVLLDELQKDPKFWEDIGNLFHARMWGKVFEQCIKCNERFPDMGVSKGVCKRCRSLRTHKEKFSKENNMDPGDQPDDLKDLTPAEEILISPVVPIMQVYHQTLGQYGYSGNVINLPQDVQSISMELPRLPQDCQIVVIRKKGQENTYRDFRVRRRKVQDALNYLIDNNPLFEDFKVLDERLAELPEDGIMEFGRVIDEEDLIDEEQAASKDEDGKRIEGGEAIPADVAMGFVEPEDHRSSEDENNEDGTSVVGSFLPVVREMRMEATLKKAEVDKALGDDIDGNPRTVGDDQDSEDEVPSERVLSWPRLDDAPIDEFRNEDYVPLAFQTLFPTGVCQAHNSKRPKCEVSQTEYYRHLMRYKDGRFARHSRFRYFALNTVLRHRMMASGRVFVKKNPEEAKLTVEELMKMARSDKEALLRKINRFKEPLSGSKEHWRARRQKLLQMIQFKKKLPTIFFTLLRTCSGRTPAVFWVNTLADPQLSLKTRCCVCGSLWNG